MKKGAAAIGAAASGVLAKLGGLFSGVSVDPETNEQFINIRITLIND